VPVDVAREARTVASEFQPLAAQREVQFEVVGDESVTVALQNGAVRQILLNLFDNAVKYGRERSTVTAEVRSLAGGGARISVTDRGAGVPLADRERIWRPFERGAAAKHRVSAGSGIGLTIVREIADDHGGRAWVEDAPGGGARFVVDLPDEKR
jgi:signal transduction histidine kinase